MFLNVGPQHPRHARRAAHRAAARRRGDRRRGAGHRLSPSRRREDGRAPDLAHLYPVHRSRRLPRRRDEQPRLLLAVEKLAGIDGAAARTGDPRDAVPSCSASSATWSGTARSRRISAQLSPVFYTFNDRERAFGIIEAICGARMHPNWFRIGGVAQDLPNGWDRLLRDFLRLSARRGLREYDRMVMRNRIFKARTKGVGGCTLGRSDRVGRDRPEPARLRLRVGLSQEAALLRLRPVRVRHPDGAARRLLRPRAGARRGDAPEPAHHPAVRGQHAGRAVQVAIIRWPRRRSRSETMHDIETLITHFLSVSWGPVIPPGEAFVRHRSHQGQQRLLPGQRRQHDGLSHAHSHAVVRASCRCCRCLPRAA